MTLGDPEMTSSRPPKQRALPQPPHGKLSGFPPKQCNSQNQRADGAEGGGGGQLRSSQVSFAEVGRTEKLRTHRDSRGVHYWMAAGALLAGGPHWKHS